MNRRTLKLTSWSAGALVAMIAGAAMAAPGDDGSPLPGGGTTRDLTMPGNGGVAGTGLGGSTSGTGDGAVGGKPSAGTGMSITGPAGEGIDGRGRSTGGISGGGGASK